MEHIYIVGQSGTGKSTMMKDMMLSDIQKGHGVLYIDPHGPDTDDLLQYIPYERRNDVVLFDPSDTEYTMAWNPLEINGHIAVITSTIERAIKDNSGYQDIGTPTMSLYIRATVAALLEAGEPLTGMSFMLTSPRYRLQVLDKVHDPLIKRFWSDFELLTPKDKRQEIASTYNKAFSMILDQRVRNIITQKKSLFSPREALSGKIILARLPQGQLGFEQVRMLGLLILSQLHLAALSHPATVPTHVYLDEVHTFEGGTLAEMLTGIRKYGVGLTMAHQNLSQLSPRLLTTVLGNTAKKYIFRVSLPDAERLNEHQGPDNYHYELNKLPRFLARLFDGEATEEVPVAFNWEADKRVPRTVRANMRRNFSRPAKTVTKELNRFIQSS